VLRCRLLERVVCWALRSGGFASKSAADYDPADRSVRVCPAQDTPALLPADHEVQLLTQFALKLASAASVAAALGA
jgi:hypothetical protein